MARRSPTIDIRFPAGGLNLRAGYDQQPTGTTPWAINVLPEDPGTLRMRGGSRPGLIRSNATATPLPDPLFSVVYRDRLVRTGADNGIYASRQGDHTDFNYGKSVGDTGRAIVFQLSEAGEVGGTPTCLIPHKDQYLLASTATSLWAIHGDPAHDGTMRNVHREVGIISSTAWCKAVDTIIFLAQNDVYKVQASGEGLENLSKGKIPEELRGITSNVCMGYDHDAGNVFIFVSGGTHWNFDIDLGGFWPVKYPSGMDPVAVSEVAGKLYLTCADGHVRTIGGTTDDNTAIDSHLLLGPVPLADPTSFGRLLNLQGTLGETSGSVAWNLITGDTAEDAVSNAQAAIAAWPTTSAYVKASGVLAAGRSHVFWPRLRAGWVVIWLQSSVAWSFDQILLETYHDGRWR